ncbi:MAG: ABC transporter permease [Actinomycetota bacterium]|nr:ABC transporter permease [Actinomycetota bacterium]
MIDLIRAEFLKIRTTRTVYGLLAAMLALVAFSVVAVLGNDPDAWRSLLLVDQEFLFMTGSVMWLFVLVLGIRSFTDEFRHGSIVPTLLANPDRRRVLLAKVVAVGATSLLFVVAAYALALVIGLPQLASVGADTSIATGAMAETLGLSAATTLLWAALGVGLGLAIRHQVAAIVGGFVWIFVIESILEGPAPDIVKYLPVHAWIAVNGPAAELVLDPVYGGLVLVAWAAAVIGAGVVLMQRRDIA